MIKGRLSLADGWSGLKGQEVSGRGRPDLEGFCQALIRKQVSEECASVTRRRGVIGQR